MSHVNQARSNDRHDDGAPEDSRLVIVVFNNDSSPYGATNCLPVAHNTSQPASQSSSKGVSRDAFRFPPPRPRCVVHSSHIARNSWPHFVEHDRRFTFPVSALSSLPFSDSSLIRLVSRVAWNANERGSLGSLARTKRILKKAAFPWNFHPSATLQRAVADFWLEPCPCNTLCNRGITQARYDPD